MKSQKPSLLFLTLITLGVILFNSCNKEEVQPTQLLSNSNVETGSALPNNWWYSSGQDKYNVTWTNQESFSPSKSLKISTQTADPANFAFWAQTINTNLPTGKDVTLKVKVKGNLTGEGVSIVIRGDDTTQPAGTAEQFVTTQGTSPISGTFNWKDYSAKLDNVDAGTQSLTVYLVYLQNTTGEVYFDDISLSY